MEGKKFLSPRGMVLCGALLLAAGALYLALSLLPQGTVAVVEQNGQEVARREPLPAGGAGNPVPHRGKRRGGDHHLHPPGGGR